MNILVTGGCGFIGSHLIEKLLENPNNNVCALDNFDDFYDTKIKRRNIESFIANKRFKLITADIRDLQLLEKLKDTMIDAIVHIAAKAGVRPSILNPFEYMNVNVIGTQNLLEFAKIRRIKQFVFASSSSVYGINKNVPWSESDQVLLPISPYASSKVSCELLGHVYSNLHGIKFIALRFFTVFGPRQRPDLAIHKFSKMLINGDKIPVYGDGSTKRDYTYVGDIVNGIVKAIHYDKTDYEVINLGNFKLISLIEMISSLEKIFGIKANLEYFEEQPGDVPLTYANISKAKELLGYSPETSFEQGLINFKEWFFLGIKEQNVIKVMS